MTLQSEVKDDPNYIAVHDHGFVGIAYTENNDGTFVPAVLGNDRTIARSARTSYGKGTRSVNDDRTLIRYLIRHKHTSPLEMCEVTFHQKLPMFIARQQIRHRTANVNELSGRYSIMPEEYYIPDTADIQPQSKDNKQGRAGSLPETQSKAVQWSVNAVSETAFDVYKCLIGEWEDKTNSPYDILNEDMLGSEFEGVARELGRIVLPLNTYTEWYWKIDLHNLFHFLRLRLHPHAQKEIRDYSEAMLELVRPFFPIAVEAFEDYIFHGEFFSAMDMKIIKEVLDYNKLNDLLAIPKKELAEQFGLSQREIDEFKGKFGL